MSRTVHVKMIDGTEHDIPEIWIAGFCTGARARGESATTEDAIYHWHWNWQMEQLEGSA